MTKLVGISGSLRKGSLNTALLRSLLDMTPGGVQIEIASIAKIPLFNQDVEKQSGIPPAVEELKDKIASSDGLLLASPEYNNSIPGVMKNAIDWLTRPPDDISRVFGERPVALMGATPGGAGTILGQNAWLPILRTLNTHPYFGNRLHVSQANKVFDDDGKLVDEKIRKKLEKFLSGFIEFVEKQKKSK